MKMATWRGRPRLRLTALAAAAVLCTGALTSGAAPADPPPDTVDPPPLSEAPPPPGATGSVPEYIVINDTTGTVPKAKLTFHAVPLASLAYVNTYIDQAGGAPLSSWIDSVAPSYVISPDKSPQPFGLFKDIFVSTLAFGAIPVSARVHLRQHEVNGVPVPLTAIVRGSGVQAKDPHDNILKPYLDAPHAFGPVDVSISDITVDQIPVDVGPACRTATSATLTLTAFNGFYKPSGTRPPPGWWQPLQTGSGGGTPFGNVDIPSFTGCHNGADDLDRLLTTLVSGPNNPVTADQERAAQKYQNGVERPKPPPTPGGGELDLSTGLLVAPGPISFPHPAVPGNTEFRTWANSEAGFPHVGNGTGWTPALTYSYFMADVNRAAYFTGVERQAACAPLVSNGNQLVMAGGGTITIGTKPPVRWTNPSPDETFNALARQAGADLATLGAQCFADPATGNWSQVLTEVKAVMDRAAELGVVPLWSLAVAYEPPKAPK